MATITPSRATHEDLLTIRDRPMPELIDGQIIERNIKGMFRDGIATMAIYHLFAYARENDLGLAIMGGRTGYQVFPDDPTKVRVVDGAFFRKERMPDRLPDGHGRIAPDLILEVVNPPDTAEFIAGKIADFLAAGVRLAWVIYPESRIVQIWRRDGTGRRLGFNEALDGEDVLPGFSCPIASLFQS